jgi:hypothetical protein
VVLSHRLQITPPVIEEFAEMQLKLPHVSLLNLGANTLTREEFREQVSTNKDLLALTVGVNPRLRFKPFPK